MSLIRLDGFKEYNNEGEIKLPGIDKTWKIKFNDKYRVQASFIASQIDKLYREQSKDSYEDELLELTPAKRSKRLADDLAEYRDACIDGLNTLLGDEKAGEYIYNHYGESTEICAQIIGKINDAADKILDISKSKEKTAKYDSER